MTQRANIVEEGIDRVQSYLRSVEDEIQKFQSQIQERREHFQKKAEKRVKRFQKELTRSKVLKRAETFREDVSKQIEKQMEQSLETLLGSLQIASRSEVKKLDQKLNRINRRLRALDKVIEEVEE
jgi:uncharacterized protein YukE